MRVAQHACSCFRNSLSHMPELRSDRLLTCSRCYHRIPLSWVFCDIRIPQDEMKAVLGPSSCQWRAYS